VRDRRFAASREALTEWVDSFAGRLELVALEATTGWRWIANALLARGVEVRLADPAEAKARRGHKRPAKTDRSDARWLLALLEGSLFPDAWLAPLEIQRLRDLTRLRKALAEDETAWAQRLHALLSQEGFPCARGRLLSAEGQRIVAGLALPEEARRYVECVLALLASLAHQLATLEGELRRFAKRDARCRALMAIYGVGPILACHLVAELGCARRFRRARSLVKASGLDVVVSESAGKRRAGRLARAGSPQLRWALVEAARHASRTGSPDHDLWTSVSKRQGKKRANLTVARKIARRAYHTLAALEAQEVKAA
jgi:transposase